MDPKSSILSSLFEYHATTGNGGVISVANITLLIDCSIFRYNTATLAGGCIYCSSSSLTITKTSFFQSSSIANDSRYRGNAMAQIRGECVLQNSNSLLCGFVSDQSSDSSISFVRTKSVVSLINISSNYGKNGGSFSSLIVEPDSEITYSNIIDSHDSFFIETENNPYDVKMINFIDCTNCLSNYICYCNSNDLYTFISCVFINLGDHTIVSTLFTYKGYDCQSDSSFSSISHVESPQTNKIIIQLQCGNITFFHCWLNFSFRAHILTYFIFMTQ